MVVIWKRQYRNLTAYGNETCLSNLYLHYTEAWFSTSLTCYESVFCAVVRTTIDRIEEMFKATQPITLVSHQIVKHRWFILLNLYWRHIYIYINFLWFINTANAQVVRSLLRGSMSPFQHGQYQYCRYMVPRVGLNVKTVFPGQGISIIKIRWSWDRLIFIMGIPWHRNTVFTLRRALGRKEPWY